MPRKEDLGVVPYIHSADELGMHLRSVYTINDYMVKYSTYKKFVQEMTNLIRGSFTIKRCREYPIKFRFYKDSKCYELEFRHFIVNLILWYSFVELHDIPNVLDESFIFDCNNDVPNINNYINYKVIKVLNNEYHVKLTRIHKAISNTLYYLREISIDFSNIMGLNFSAITFFDMYENNPRIREIMETTFSNSQQPHEIENILHQLQAEEIDIYKNTPNNPIGVILGTKTGIKEKQFAEFTISEGLKPSLQGETIPEVIENSTMLKGLDRPSYLYIDATGSRKSFLEYRF